LQNIFFSFFRLYQRFSWKTSKEKPDFSNIKTLRVEKHPLQVFRERIRIQLHWRVHVFRIFLGVNSSSDLLGFHIIFGGLLAEFLGFEALLSNHSFGGSVDSSMKLGVLNRKAQDIAGDKRR